MAKRLRAPIQPGAARLDLFRHHHRHPKLRRICHIGPDKTARRDSYDSERMSIEENLLPDDGGITGESFLPAGMTQDDDRMRAGRLIFVGQKTAA